MEAGPIPQEGDHNQNYATDFIHLNGLRTHAGSRSRCMGRKGKFPCD